LREARFFEDVKGEDLHRSVLLEDSLQLLAASSGGLFIDATVGLGGHSEGILEASTQTQIIGIDRDADALSIAADRLSPFGGRVRLFQANYSDIRSIVDTAGVGQPQGVIADLGVSSLQFDSETRGFSFRFDAPLDMRMDAASGMPTAADLLATLSEWEIADIIYRYGEERASRKIARWIVEKRENGEPIQTTFQLADLVKRAVRQSDRDKVHPATRTFQALRIAVNNELNALKTFLLDAVDILTAGGVLAVITFHSLEDRIVKHSFQRLSGKCLCPPRIPQCQCGAVKRVDILTRKPVFPGEAELIENPRSRSAKLRACRKRADNLS
jgi:16S rRNA (cytosine1402-N4)-methyltransferase